MSADFHINLTKEMTSSPEERGRFYNGMLIYLVICFAGLVGVAYRGSVNMTRFLENRAERSQILNTVAAVSGVTPADFDNPAELFRALEDRAFKIGELNRALGQRVRLLPIINNLFVDLPARVSLQSLSANKEQLTFGLFMPLSTDESGDLVKMLSVAWENNEELMKRVVSIRPLKSERQTMGAKSFFYVQFECVLKK